MGEKVLVKDGRELVVAINACQLGQHESSFPLENPVLVVQQTDEKIEMGIKQLGTFLADDAERFGAAILDARLVCLQAPGEFLRPAGILHRPPGELARVRSRFAESCKRSSHAPDFTIGRLTGQIHTRSAWLVLRDSLWARSRAAATGSATQRFLSIQAMVFCHISGR